jgi:hypothetical protein
MKSSAPHQSARCFITTRGSNGDEHDRCARANLWRDRDRLLAAAAIAEAAVKIVKAANGSKMISFNDRSYKPTVPELAISIDAPHHLRGDNIARIKHLARVFHSDLIMAAFALNIWTPDKKVLNAEYYGSSIGFASFRRGRWENALLSAAERSPIAITVKSRIQ